jgi:hypothetical protein
MPSVDDDILQDLNGCIQEGDVSVGLTEAGLLPKRTETAVRLYAETRSWTEVKQQWHEERVHGRGSRGSAQKILRLIQRRLQAGGSTLPSTTDLHALVEECPTTRAKAQLFYFYLVEEDPLVQFVLHHLLRNQGTDREEWQLDTSTIAEYLESFRYEGGSALDYADSTLHRWAQGFRSVLRDIGVIEGKYDEVGRAPSLDFPPVHVGAFYSWNKEGEEWPRRPIGWYYLFQSPARQDALLDRLQASDRWESARVRSQTVLRPAGHLEASE